MKRVNIYQIAQCNYSLTLFRQVMNRHMYTILSSSKAHAIDCQVGIGKIGASAMLTHP